ncbi:Serine/threonine protein kinase [Globisporangium polare]
MATTDTPTCRRTRRHCHPHRRRPNGIRIALLLLSVTAAAQADALAFRDAVGGRAQGTVTASSASTTDDNAFFTDTPVSSRFERVFTDGLEGPQLTGVSVPQEITKTLTMHQLRWENLDGNLQRMLLWDAGYVPSSSSNDASLARVYTQCGLTMDDIVLSKPEFDQLGCLSTRCNGTSGDSTSGVYRSSALEMECPDNMVAQVVKCATKDQVQAVSAASFWAQEANNTDIPQPLIVRNSARTYSIQVQSSSSSIGSQPAASTGLCPSQPSLIIPCTTFDDDETAKWCTPKATGRIALLLIEVANKLNGGSASSGSQTGSSSDNDSLSVGEWVAVGLGGLLVIALCIAAHLRLRRRMQQSVAVALSEEKGSSEVTIDVPRATGDFFFAPGPRSTTESTANVFSMFTPVLTIPALSSFLRNSHNGSNNNGLAKSASYSDIICTSEVMMEFQCDPVVIDKRVPIVDLKFDKLVCQGASGEIHTGTYNGNRVALKQVLRVRMNDPKEIEKFAREIQLHATLQHPNIVPFLGVAWNSFQNLVMVMEYKPGGDLLRALRRNGKQWTWATEKFRVAFGIVKALAYLHGLHKPVIHRDIKSRNILVDERSLEPLLCDFGASCSVENLGSVDFVTTDPAGTILWSAPEVIKAQDYSEKADVYSFGVVLTELDTCKLPYKEEKDRTGRQVQAIRIARMVVDDQIKPALTPECPDFIRRIAQACLHHDPDKRPSTRELQLYFTDPARYSFEWGGDACNTNGDLGSSAEWEMKRGSLFCL